jgi:Fanconi anemia group M protein
LAEQHLKYFKKNLPELFGEMELFTGKVNAENRRKIWQTADIIFSTPQCVANDLRNNLYNLGNVCLLIEDEAHRCLKSYDYNYVAKEYVNQAKNPRILGLTASPGSEKSKIKEICKNLFVEEVELRTRESEDVKPYLQELKFEKIIVNFPKEFEEIRHVFKELYEHYVEELRARHVLFGPANKITLIELQRKIFHMLSMGNKNFNYMLGASACANAIKISHSLELLETQTLLGFNKYLRKLIGEAEKEKSKGIQRLVKKPEFNFVWQRTNELIEKGFEHPKLAKLEEIITNEVSRDKNIKIIVFTQFRETASIICKILNNVDGIKAKIFVGQSKKTDSKTGETTGLNQKEQQEIIQEFSKGEINVLCATSIGEEGLDIPEVNEVIFYEPIPSAIRKIQRAGRTARLMKGKLVILITKDTKDESSFWAAHHKEKKMHSAIESIKEELKGKLKPEETAGVLGGEKQSKLS